MSLRVLLHIVRQFCRPAFARRRRPSIGRAGRIGAMLVACAHSSLFLAAAGAEPPVASSLTDQSAAAQRLQIEQQRSSLDDAYAREKANCQRRFFVNRCLDQAAHAYREHIHVLDVRLANIDLEQRMQRAAAERARVQRNLRERHEVQVQNAGRDHEQQAVGHAQSQGRESVTTEAFGRPDARHAKVQRRFDGATRAGIVPPGISEASSPQAQSAYAAKLAEYKRRQQDAAKRRQQRPPAAPLPVPPGY